MTTHVREHVRERYAEAAVGLSSGCGCGCDCDSIGCCGEEATTLFGQGLYGADERAGLPETAVAASLGCGNPLALVELHWGETVLDLGSGGGIDVLLSGKRVGETGIAYGLDMTDEMLALARENAALAGATNVRFLKGLIEAIPLDDATVDVVISNCVVNLSPEKDRVLAEIACVLRPGGRIGISDVIAEDRLTPADRAERGSHVGCIAGALSKSEYRTGLESVGLVDVEVEFTHVVADGMHGAMVHARKPESDSPSDGAGTVAGVEYVDVYVNRRPFGHTYMQDDRLEGAITPRGRRRTRVADCARCPHERVVQAFAHRRSRDEHWPIAYCVDCFGIVAGLDPLVRARRPRWKFDERNAVVNRWTRDWPKRGRPRSDAPPASTAWPDAA